jgi:thioredoxin reductase
VDLSKRPFVIKSSGRTVKAHSIIIATGERRPNTRQVTRTVCVRAPPP